MEDEDSTVQAKTLKRAGGQNVLTAKADYHLNPFANEIHKYNVSAAKVRAPRWPKQRFFHTTKYRRRRRILKKGICLFSANCSSECEASLPSAYFLYLSKPCLPEGTFYYCTMYQRNQTSRNHPLDGLQRHISNCTISIPTSQ